MTHDRWIYERAADGSARFVLGTVGLNPLVCFGINPSTAAPNAPDRTVARASRFAADNGYDSWTMLNVYPQIATDPQDLDRAYRQDLKAENERQIAAMIAGHPLTLLAAWGGLIASRPYLPSLLRDILKLTTGAGCDWVSLGDSTKDGHPRHPLYVRADTTLQPFSVERYLRGEKGARSAHSPVGMRSTAQFAALLAEHTADRTRSQAMAKGGRSRLSE